MDRKAGSMEVTAYRGERKKNICCADKGKKKK